MCRLVPKSNLRRPGRRIVNFFHCMYITHFCSRRGAHTYMSNFVRSAHFKAAKMHPRPHPQQPHAWDEYGNALYQGQSAPGTSKALRSTSKPQSSQVIMGVDLIEDIVLSPGYTNNPPPVYAAKPLAAQKLPRNRRDAKVPPSRASGGIPNPTPTYINSSCVPPQNLQEPQHLLVIIDLNGTLLFRPSKTQPTKFVARPHAKRFLQYCIDTFTVVIWSSARPENVRNMCEAILTPELRKKVAAIWGRDRFGLSNEDYNTRVQCYKRLTNIWKDRNIAQCHPEHELGGRWDQTNTVLVDDSLEKGRSEPYNLIQIPEFTGNLKEAGEILPQVHDYLNHLSRHSNVSACLRAFPFRAQAAPQGPPGLGSTTGNILSSCY